MDYSQAPLFMGCSKQEYWSGLPFPPPGDIPHPGIKPMSPIFQADSLPKTTTKFKKKPISIIKTFYVSFCKQVYK